MTTAPANRVEWNAPDAAVWELETFHGTGIGPVPLRSEFEEAFAEGFRRSFATLGVPLSHIELRHVNGWPYTSIFLHDVPRKAGDPPPAIVLKALTRIHPGFRKRTKIARAALAERRPQRFAEDWFAERDSWISRILALQSKDMADMTDAQLAAHIGDVAGLASEALRRHFEFVAGCIPVGEWLVHANSWGLDPAKARQAVMHGTPVHTEAHERLQRVADALGDAEPTSYGEIRSHSDEAAAALDDYLAHHGWWATEDNPKARTVREFPEVVIATINGRRRAAADDRRSLVRSDEVLAELRREVTEAERSAFDRVARDAHRSYMMLDDNSGILGSWTAGLAGRVVRMCADRLVDRGRIGDRSHAWSLSIDDIAGLLDGGSALSPDDVAERYRAWQDLARLDPPPHLNGPPGAPPDAGVFPAPVAQLVTAITTFLADKFNYTRETVGIGAGVATGRAVVAADAGEAIDRIEPGDILVTSATTPAYNTILPIVGGLIVSEGGLSSHAAVVARELGVPALVGYEGALKSIPDGTFIELDPIRARVTFLDR